MAIYTISLLLLVAGPGPATADVARAGCPLDSFRVTPESVEWGPFRIDMTLDDLEQQLGHGLTLEPEIEWGGESALVIAEARAVTLSFKRSGRTKLLTAISLRRMGHDGKACWSRDALVGALRQRAPDARYLPSRHAPDLSEEYNDTPTFSVADDGEIVVLLKPEHGTVFIGHSAELD